LNNLPIYKRKLWRKKIKELFEKNTDNDIIKTLDEWWGKYQENKQNQQKNSSSLSDSNKK
jgi:hypothetical protein